MSKWQQAVEDFHQKVGANVSDSPSMTTPDERRFRASLIAEELREYEEATTIEGVYDALVDILYVTLGSFVSHGLDAEAGFREVHRSNMTKENCRIKTGEKVPKGPNYSPPDLLSILEGAKP